MYSNYCTDEMSMEKLRKIINFHNKEIGTDYEVNTCDDVVFSAMFFELLPEESKKLADFENSLEGEKS